MTWGKRGEGEGGGVLRDKSLSNGGGDYKNSEEVLSLPCDENSV